MVANIDGAQRSNHHTQPMTVDMDAHCKDEVAEWENHAVGRAYTWDHGTFKVIEARTSTDRVEGQRMKSRTLKIQYADSESYGSIAVDQHRTLVKTGNIEPAPQSEVSHLDD